MAGQLGDLVISLSADLARFRDDMGKASKVSQEAAQSIVSAHKSAVDDIQKVYGGLADGIQKAMGAIAVVTGVLQGGKLFSNAVSETVSFELETAKLAKTLGISTEQATIYKQAMSLVGIDQEVMINAAMRMARTLNTSSDAFKEIGVDIDVMRKSGSSNVEIMMATIAALDKYKGGLDKNQAAMTIFSRSWGEVQQLQKLSPEIIKNATEEVEKYNLAVSPESAARAREYKMAMHELGEVTEVMAITLGRELIPKLTEVASLFAEQGPAAVRVFTSALHGIEDAIKAVSKESDTLIIFAVGLSAPLIASGISSLASALMGVSVSVAAINAAMAANPVGFAALTAAATYWAGNKAVKGVYQATGIDLNGVQAPQAALEKSQAQLGISTEALNKRLKDLGFSSWVEFDKAAKAGTVVFNDLSGLWDKTAKKDYIKPTAAAVTTWQDDPELVALFAWQEDMIYQSKEMEAEMKQMAEATKLVDAARKVLNVTDAEMLKNSLAAIENEIKERVEMEKYVNELMPELIKAEGEWLGIDNQIIANMIKLSDGLKKEIDLADKLATARNLGLDSEVKKLQTVISLQQAMNNQLVEANKLAERAAVLKGDIVGFSDTAKSESNPSGAIYRDAYSRQQQAEGNVYTTDQQLMSGVQNNNINVTVAGSGNPQRDGNAAGQAIIMTISDMKYNMIGTSMWNL